MHSAMKLMCLNELENHFNIDNSNSLKLIFFSFQISNCIENIDNAAETLMTADLYAEEGYKTLAMNYNNYLDCLTKDFSTCRTVSVTYFL